MRIGITGSMSVGKTTLVKELSILDKFKDYKCITERSKYLRDLGIPLNTDSTFEGQTIFLAERANELMNDNLITDRTVIDVMAFTQNAKSLNKNLKENFEHFAKNFINKYDYIFYIPVEGTKIEDNLVRETNTIYRSVINHTIKYFIGRYKHRIKNFYSIPPYLSTKERIEFIIDKIK